MSYSRTVSLPVAAEEAFALVTEPERLRRWQTVTARVDLRAGGDFRWTVLPGHIAAGTVRELDPGRRVVLGWGWHGAEDPAPDASTVTIIIEPVDDASSTVTLEHTGLTPEQAERHAQGWTHYLDRLERLATTGDAGPDEWAAVPDPLDAFGVAEATLASLLRVLRGVTEQQAPTPCSDFDAHALAEHLFGSIQQLGAMAGASITTPDTGSLEDRVATMADQAIDAWRAQGADGMDSTDAMDSSDGSEGSEGSDGSDRGPSGDRPATWPVTVLAIEFLLHGWDFAESSGRTIEVSDEVVAWLHEHARSLIANGRERGAFAAEVTPSPDATALSRLVAFSGRRPLVPA